MDVGRRELKAKLSEYVSQAAGGHEVTVTDRGRPVARLVPFRAETEIERGIAEGWVQGPRRHGLMAVERADVDGSTLDVLADDRG
jgi:prevent-host-death family protein